MSIATTDEPVLKKSTVNHPVLGLLLNGHNLAQTVLQMHTLKDADFELGTES